MAERRINVDTFDKLIAAEDADIHYQHTWRDWAPMVGKRRDRERRPSEVRRSFNTRLKKIGLLNGSTSSTRITSAKHLSLSPTAFNEAVGKAACGVTSGVTAGVSMGMRGAEAVLNMVGHMHSLQDDFCQACFDGNAETAHLLRNMADVDVNGFGRANVHRRTVYRKLGRMTPAGTSITPKTAAMFAAEGGQLEILRLLSLWDADLNLPDENGHTPAHFAARANRVHTLRLLAELGATLITADENNQTAYDLAVKDGHRPVISAWPELMELSDMIHQEDPRITRERSVKFVDLTAPMESQTLPRQRPYGKHLRRDTQSFMQITEEFRRACLANDVDKVRAMYTSEEVQDVNSVGRFGNTPAVYAAEAGSVEILRLLHKWGAVLDTRNNTNNTPAHFAALNNHGETLRVLNELGADLDARNLNGKTPAHVAARKGKLDALRVLAQLGANFTIMDNQGFTPHCCAIRTRHENVTRAFPDLLALSTVMRRARGLDNAESTAEPPPMLESSSRARRRLSSQRDFGWRPPPDHRSHAQAEPLPRLKSLGSFHDQVAAREQQIFERGRSWSMAWGPASTADDKPARATRVERRSPKPRGRLTARRASRPRPNTALTHKTSDAARPQPGPESHESQDPPKDPLDPLALEEMEEVEQCRMRRQLSVQRASIRTAGTDSATPRTGVRMKANIRRTPGLSG